MQDKCTCFELAERHLEELQDRVPHVVEGANIHVDVLEQEVEA